ncbi:hypothetical protein Aple_048770 [Acrocarpospora pleiomorpha]|uniref:WXG100 family type VII secretion target n=1 Tax=Acrocarpospora pleiomorpha TaxID=90975 RepID=A0A5M3XLZ9_9ACTN|nr:WXG100 family type VII secretion target [Acrocarpospora pleiomorpha]GES21980.1 hypothetical protein Aple_048770 [Acrocarpospora pleiomorpha]
MAGNPHRILQEAMEKEALARIFESRAGELEVVFKGILMGPGRSGGYWTGGAADRFADASHHLDKGMAELVETCRMTARNLRRTAEQLRGTAMLPTS